jgi:hypothetical protein
MSRQAPCTHGLPIPGPMLDHTWSPSFHKTGAFRFARCSKYLGPCSVLYAVGYFVRLAFGRAAGSFAQFVLWTCFLSTCLVIPDLNRLLFLQTIVSLGAIACLTGIYWSAQCSLQKPGTLPLSTLVSETLLPVDDVNALIALSPILLVIVTNIGMFESA